MYWAGRKVGRAVPQVIGRHAHPKAPPDDDPAPAALTGIDYLQLVDLHGQAGQGGGVASAGAVLVDERAQVGPPVEGGAADAGARGYLAEGDGLPGRGELGAGGLDPGLVVLVSWHGPGR